MTTERSQGADAGVPPGRAWAFAALAVTAIAYHRVLGCYFHDDDFVNHPLTTTLLRPWAGHLLLLCNAISFGLYRVVHLAPLPYFLLVLTLHLGAVGLLFSLVRSASGSPRVAAVAAASWGASPILADTLNWFSVYGEILALALALLVFRQAERCATGGRATLGSSFVWAALWMGAATSFGMGLALALVSPLLLAVLVPASRRDRGVPLVWLAVPVVVVAVYVGCHIVTRSYRDEADALRLAWLTTAHGWLTVALMLAGLADVGAGWAAAGLVTPLAVLRTTPPFVLGVTVLLLSAWAASRAAPGLRRPVLALLVAVVSQYAMVALGRASLYTAIAPAGVLAAVGESRYQYAPTAMATAAAALAVDAVTAGTRARRTLGRWLAACWLVAAAGALAWTPLHVDTHPNARAEAADFVRAVTAQTLAAPGAAPVCLENRPFRSVGILPLVVPEVYPGWAATFTVYFPENRLGGHPVYFVERRANVIAAVRALPGSRIDRLVVTPDAPACTAPQ